MKCKILLKPRTQSIFCCVIIITEKCSKNYGIVKLTSLTTFVDEICTHSNLLKQPNIGNESQQLSTK